MTVGFELEVDMDVKKLQRQFESLVDDKCMLEIHNLFAKMMNDYVPMSEGVLAQTLDVTKDRVRYNVPYAHYQYIGDVYGPNIPIIEDGIIVGWFSPPGQKKHPTGQKIKYNQEYHPKASKEWDKAMMNTDGEQFIEAVKNILLERCKELYG